jgi:L-threonylcarbamoyladenylate synthase
MTTETGSDVARAAALLRADEVVAIPTETVYGLAGRIASETAIRKIFAAKNRPLSDPLIVHVPEVSWIPDLVLDFPDLARELLAAFAPGPLTVLLPKSDRVSDLVTNASPWVAIRIPAHPLALRLLQELGEPLAAPSANPFGGISPTTAAHVQAGLGGRIPYILDGGPSEVGLESTIVRLSDNKLEVLRQGGIAAEDLALFAELLEKEDSGKPVVPGSMLSHYAPRKPLYLEGNLPAEAESLRWACLRFQTLLPGVPAERQVVLSPSGDVKVAARNLFSALHQLDQLETDAIRAEVFPEIGLGRAILDRLYRASVKRGFLGLNV